MATRSSFQRNQDVQGWGKGTCMGAYAGTTAMDTLPCGSIESPVMEPTRPITELDDIDGLVRNYRARILRFVTYSTGDPDLAETITQDTLLRAYRGRESFRGDCSVSTWLTGIAINVTRDHMRSAKFKFWKKAHSTALDVQELASFIPSEATSPERQILAKEKVARLTEVLQELSPNQKTVFLMKFFEEISVNEISEILQMPVNTVRTHLHRALHTVRARLGASV
ncbi:RNA polymerase sigma factor [Telmatobacter bradus]|uniref:RNA polymerase sigma factor n=1 Tax=Telmatobacter bradus TaxID=474953 RepID=UPI003B430956